MKFAKAENVTRYNLDVPPLKVKGRDFCFVQSDTDSLYLCLQELKEEIFPDLDGFVWFDAVEQMLQDMWAKVLQIRADKRKMPQLIKFVRENMFYGFFSYAKKLYIGSVVDSEGDRFSFEEPHNKIRGVILQKKEFPEFCKINATPLAFKIMHGLSREEAIDEVLRLYDLFKQQPPDAMCSNRSVSDYSKFVTHDISWYVQRGLSYAKGMPANVKLALAYNYVCAKHHLVLDQIERGAKFKYVFVKPTNRYGIDSIAFVNTWPAAFNEIFEIDYETAFRKFLLDSAVEPMFRILGWLGEKDHISLQKTVSIKKFITNSPRKINHL